jgi:hypothetical protein
MLNLQTSLQPCSPFIVEALLSRLQAETQRRHCRISSFATTISEASRIPCSWRLRAARRACHGSSEVYYNRGSDYGFKGDYDRATADYEAIELDPKLAQAYDNRGHAHERTRAGLASARGRGRKGGRRPKRRQPSCRAGKDDTDDCEAEVRPRISMKGGQGVGVCNLRALGERSTC